MKAKRAGLEGLPLTPAVLAAARAARVWQADLVPLWVEFDQDPGARPAVSIVTAGEMVVHCDMHRRPSGEPGEVARLLGEGVLEAIGRVGGSPHTLQVRFESLVDPLRETMGSGGVETEVEHRPRLDHLEPAALALQSRIAGSAGPGFEPDGGLPMVASASTWEGWDLPPARVAGLFDAAAAFHRARPWEELDDEARIAYEGPHGRSWAVSVMGNGGIEFGAAIYAQPRDRDAILEGMEPPFAGLRPPAIPRFTGRCLSLSFERAEDLPATMRREVMHAGWTVTSPEAYPWLVTLQTPGGGVTADDVADLEEILRRLVEATGPLSEAYGAGEALSWRSPDGGATLRLEASPGGVGTWGHGWRLGGEEDVDGDLDSEQAWLEDHDASFDEEDPALDPAVEARLDELLDLLDTAGDDGDDADDLLDEAERILWGYAAREPDGFLAGRKPEILVAGALHAAGMYLAYRDRPTLEELADHWGVSAAAVAQRSLAMRDAVPRLGLGDFLARAVDRHMDSVVARLGEMGVDLREMLEAAGFEPPIGPLDPQVLAELTGLEAADLARLEAALRRGLDAHDRKGGRGDNMLSLLPLPERLESSVAAGAALREVYRSDTVGDAVRTAVARWVVGRLVRAILIPFEDVPDATLLPLAHLARTGGLEGATLVSAVLLAVDVDHGAGAELSAEEIHPLVRGLGRVADDSPDRVVGVLLAVVERTELGRDGRRGPALVDMIASEEALPRVVRQDVLLRVSGFDDREEIPHLAGAATRRRALVLRARMEDHPERSLPWLLDLVEDEALPGLAAAEVFESHGAALDPDDLEAIVRRGLRAVRSSVRQAFFAAARVLVGDRVFEWAPDDVAKAARKRGTLRKGEHPDQKSLF